MASRKEQRETARQERQRQEAAEQARLRRQRLVQLGSAAVLLAAVAVAVVIVVSQSGGGSGGDTKLEDVKQVNSELHGLDQQGLTLGDPKAKVTVVEFGDLQCPVCQEFSVQTAPDLISKVVRKGTAKYEFSQFTIIGPDSTDAAKAALAASEQNRYWNYIDLFYRNQGTENSGYITDDFLTSVAEGAGVPNIAKWNQDRQSPKWDAVLSKVQSEAQSLGISATPTIVVQGPGGSRVVGSGVLPVSQIESAIKSVS
jgi:protein-disulfide isomerase